MLALEDGQGLALFRRADVDHLIHFAAQVVVRARADDLRRREALAVGNRHDVVDLVDEEAVALRAPFHDQDLAGARVRQRRHGVQLAQVDDADHLLAQVEHAAHAGRHARRRRDGAAEIDDLAHLADFHGELRFHRKRDVHAALRLVRAGRRFRLGRIQPLVAVAHLDDFALRQDLLVVEENDVAQAFLGDAAGKHGRPRLAQQGNRQHLVAKEMHDAVDGIDEKADRRILEPHDDDALLRRGRLAGLGRLQQGGEIDDGHLAAAKMHASQAQFAVQDGAVQFRHLDDFLDGQHFEGKRGAGRVEADALAPVGLRVVAGRAELGAAGLQGQHVGHVLDAQQGVRVENLQQARAAIQQDGAGDHGMAVAGRVVQGAAPGGGHAQDLARVLENDADQHLLEIQDGDLVRVHGAGRVGAEQSTQVDDGYDAAAQGEHAFQIRRRQGQGGHFRGIIHHFADAAGGQGEFIVAQIEGTEQFRGGIAFRLAVHACRFMHVHTRLPCLQVKQRRVPPHP